MKVEHFCAYSWGSPLGSVVKNTPASAGDARDTGSIPGLERSLEEVAAHFSILAWKISRTEEPCSLQSMGCLKESNTAERLSMHAHTYSSSQQRLGLHVASSTCTMLPSKLGFRKESSREFLWCLSLVLRNRGLFLVLDYQLYLTVFSPERETGVPVRDNLLPTYFKNIKWYCTSCSSNGDLKKKNFEVHFHKYIKIIRIEYLSYCKKNANLKMKALELFKIR